MRQTEKIYCVAKSVKKIVHRLHIIHGWMPTWTKRMLLYSTAVSASCQNNAWSKREWNTSTLHLFPLLISISSSEAFHNQIVYKNEYQVILTYQLTSAAEDATMLQGNWYWMDATIKRIWKGRGKARKEMWGGWFIILYFCCRQKKLYIFGTEYWCGK